MYANILVKTMYIHDCELKTRIQEEKCIKTKANRQVETNFTPIRHYQAYMPPDSASTLKQHSSKALR